MYEVNYKGVGVETLDMATEQATENNDEVIAPGGPSGIRPADVLEQAETDDMVDVELEFLQIDEMPVPALSGTVANTSEEPLEDGSNKQVLYYLELDGDLFERMILKLVTDTESAHAVIQDRVAVGDGWFDELDVKDIDLHHIEVTKA